MKTFADDKLTNTQIMWFVWEGTENIVGKGENAGYVHFLFFIHNILFTTVQTWLKDTLYYSVQFFVWKTRVTLLLKESFENITVFKAERSASKATCLQ